MHRFYLPLERGHESSVMLTGREAHHGLRVLRIRKGDEVTLLDGKGHIYFCEVSDTGRDAIRLEMRQKTFVEPSPYRITLVQAIPKGKIFDSIVQKATELGVFRVIPLLSARVITQLEHPKSENRAEHWRAVAIEAIKQCGSAWLPEIEAPVSPQGLLSRRESFDLFFIASLGGGARHPREWFCEFQKARNRKPGSICVWVGPEGDFSPDEIAAAKAAGAVPITLGRLVLRSETAAMYCLSVLQYELQSTTF
jgi:16S rRNA (uracil1498-N3)-methyltransferase